MIMFKERLLKQIKMLELPNAKVPFVEWKNDLSLAVCARIDNFVRRVANGGAKKNIKALGDGVFEIKISYGPGFRVYFSEVEGAVILLLLGGDKASQKRDIRQAKKYWREYNVQNKII